MLRDRQFKIIMLTMSRVLMEKVDSKQEDIDNVSRVLETLRRIKGNATNKNQYYRDEECF